jgi:hypothetical protein
MLYRLNLDRGKVYFSCNMCVRCNMVQQHPVWTTFQMNISNCLAISLFFRDIGGIILPQAGMEDRADANGSVDRDAFADIIDPRALLGASGADNAGIIEVQTPPIARVHDSCSLSCAGLCIFSLSGAKCAFQHQLCNHDMKWCASCSWAVAATR